MTAPIDRTLAVLELLSLHPEGLSLQAVATRLELPPSATHRLLNDLLRLGYVCQPIPQGPYALTMRLAALGLSWLGRTGISDMAQPVLDRLATDTGELVRLSLADGAALVWVAVAQGATSGLRYDPAREQGSAASLAYSASGRAWVATLPEDRALALIAAQGLTPPEGAAQGSRLDMDGVLQVLARTRASGHAEAVDCFLDGMAAIAVPLPAEGPSPGCLSIAGPAVRLTAPRRAELLPLLNAAAVEIIAIAPASRLLRGAL
ncbi:IclR family transcriptional regulator [Frigidibacter sp.]|uniref:IclR family transcriptional regulator n=1 Tax=Frigidibacter sp. TaxID=2586418 RepID=UPI0027351DA6|nr:IclR family transcriptional regulator [Frigidibacter sp.]MDP3339574.1 IclR family transcriptional regulator [Frigidibacter sp.]